jgi:hypothetical protein
MRACNSYDTDLFQMSALRTSRSISYNTSASDSVVTSAAECTRVSIGHSNVTLNVVRNKASQRHGALLGLEF